MSEDIVQPQTEDQKKMQSKIERINAILKEEPQCRIIGTLKVTEFGIMPSDPKLIPLSDAEKDVKPEDEGEGGGVDEGGQTESTGEQPTEA